MGKIKKLSTRPTRPNPNVFDCPVCGNEIFRSDRRNIKCPWWNRWIIPKGKTIKQEAGVNTNEKNREQQEG